MEHLAMKEEGNKKNLINEKIVGRQLTFRKALKYFVVAAVCGLLFGCMAALAFIGVSRAQAARAEAEYAETELQTEEDPFEATPETFDPEAETEDPAVSEAVEESKEEMSASEEGTDVSAEETLSESDSGMEETGSEPESDIDPDETGEETLSESEPGEEETGTVETDGDNSGTYELDAAETLIALQKKVVEMTRPYVVTVNAITTGTTWFESPAESTQSFAGIILDVTDQEILILTTGGPTESETLRVTFAEGTTKDAYIKQLSVRDELAIVAVPIAEESGDAEVTFSGIMPADSFSASVGDPVVAVGAPLGVVNSCAFGSIGYISETEPALDASQRILYADIRTNVNKGTFIIDRDGELLGIAANQNEKNGFDSGLARIITIGSIKETLDRLEAGEKQAYIGLEGFGVSGEMLAGNLPEGMYITNVYTDSPAYNAGIKRGDIVAEMKETPVRDTFDYEKIMRTIHPEDMVELLVRRGSADGEYREISFMLSAGER